MRTLLVHISVSGEIVSREGTGKSDMIIEGTGKFCVNENGNAGMFVSI